MQPIWRLQSSHQISSYMAHMELTTLVQTRDIEF
uniref:Uncharacterized protein n=1 Tax=Rhizophora mucronata TaxID=61149 RepID=A0A2P2J2M7_RHIMU